MISETGDVTLFLPFLPLGAHAQRVFTDGYGQTELGAKVFADGLDAVEQVLIFILVSNRGHPVG